MRGPFPLFLALFLGIGIGFAQENPGIETQAVTLQGKGTLTTRPFTVQDQWHLEWASDAPIRIRVLSPNGGSANTVVDSTTPTPTPSILPAGSSGSSAAIAQGGTYTLEVTTTGSWQASMFENGFAKNLNVGGTLAYSPPSFRNHGNDHLVTYFSGTGQTTTRPFTVKNGWEMQWIAFGPTKFSLVPSDSTPATIIADATSPPDPAPAPVSAIPSTPAAAPAIYPNGYANRIRRGSAYQVNGGTFTLATEGNSPWTVRIVEINPPGTSSPSDENPSPAPAPVPGPPPISKLTDEQAKAVVSIKGDNGEGTGFLVKTPSGAAVVTNIHVIANNPNLKIITSTGTIIPMLSAKGASDRDLALLAVDDTGYSYLEFSTDISRTVQPGDEIITPGSDTNAAGKVAGIGSERIEIDCPRYGGQSGGPLFHTSSGKVLGVVTQVNQVDLSRDLDKNSYSTRISAQASKTRPFGLRLDTVAAWTPIDWKRFQIETLFLDQFHEKSLALDSYLNGGEMGDTNALYRKDDTIVKANDRFDQLVAGRDVAQRNQYLRGLLLDLATVADTNMDQIQNMSNFYSFDQDRAQDEIAYRKALAKELDAIGNDSDRLNSLPRPVSE